MSRMKAYIAGKITGDPDYKKKFAEAEERLKKFGLKVVNPAAEDDDKCYKEWIDRGLKLLMECDIIYLLEDWRDSQGATLERNYARTVGMLITEE